MLVNVPAMCAALSPLQPCPLCGGKFRFLSRPIPGFNALPLQALLGLLFSFSAFSLPSLSHLSLPSRGEIVFLVPGLCRCSRIRPQLAHTAPTGPVWGSTGVVPLFGSQNRTQGRTRAFSLFPSTCSTFPLRGKVGLNSHPSCSARPNSSTTSPHGFNGAGNPSYWCRFPTRPTKPHTGPHRAEFGFHRLFLVRFGSGRVDKSFSSL